MSSSDLFNRARSMGFGKKSEAPRRIASSAESHGNPCAICYRVTWPLRRVTLGFLRFHQSIETIAVITLPEQEFGPPPKGDSDRGSARFEWSFESFLFLHFGPETVPIFPFRYSAGGNPQKGETLSNSPRASFARSWFIPNPEIERQLCADGKTRLRMFTTGAANSLPENGPK